MSDEKRETVSDIVAQMRGRGEDGRMDMWLWRQYADRIEAAWKRESKAIATENAVLPAVCITKPSGNAAAMREALFDIVMLTMKVGYSIHGDVACGIIASKAKRALSAPARNCDRFVDETDAQIAFLNEVWLISVDRETMLARDKYENWSDEMRTRYGKWLLAPAAERKGEDDDA